MKNRALKSKLCVHLQNRWWQTVRRCADRQREKATFCQPAHSHCASSVPSRYWSQRCQNVLCHLREYPLSRGQAGAVWIKHARSRSPLWPLSALPWPGPPEQTGANCNTLLVSNTDIFLNRHVQTAIHLLRQSKFNTLLVSNTEVLLNRYMQTTINFLCKTLTVNR